MRIFRRDLRGKSPDPLTATKHQGILRNHCSCQDPASAQITGRDGSARFWPTAIAATHLEKVRETFSE